MSYLDILCISGRTGTVASVATLAVGVCLWNFLLLFLFLLFPRKSFYFFPVLSCIYIGLFCCHSRELPLHAHYCLQCFHSHSWNIVCTVLKAIFILQKSQVYLKLVLYYFCMTYILGIVEACQCGRQMWYRSYYYITFATHFVCNDWIYNVGIMSDITVFSIYLCVVESTHQHHASRFYAH